MASDDVSSPTPSGRTPMPEVGLRELKAKLSEYVNRVRGGEAFLITDRGVPVAELRRVGGEGVLDQLAAKGLVSRGNGHKDLPPPLDLGFSLSDLILHERER